MFKSEKRERQSKHYNQPTDWTYLHFNNMSTEQKKHWKEDIKKQLSN